MSSPTSTETGVLDDLTARNSSSFSNSAEELLARRVQEKEEKEKDKGKETNGQKLESSSSESSSPSSSSPSPSPSSTSSSTSSSSPSPATTTGVKPGKQPSDAVPDSIAAPNMQQNGAKGAPKANGDVGTAGKTEAKRTTTAATPTPAATTVPATRATAANGNGHVSPRTKKKGMFRNLLRKLGRKKVSADPAPKHGTAGRRVDAPAVAPPPIAAQVQGPIFAANYHELPEDLQKQIVEAAVDLDGLVGENWEVMLNVLRFVTKLSLATDHEAYKIRKKQREARDVAASNLPDEMRQAAEESGAILMGRPKNVYQKAEFLGKGGFGRVFTVRSTIDKRIVAIKKTQNKTSKEKRRNKDEVAILYHCNHPNIVRFKRAYSWDDEVAIVMEYLEGGSLSAACKKKPFEEPAIALVAREVLNSISYLHSQNLVHRDLKSANIMMSIKGDVKLIDFGLAVHIDCCHRGMVGSPFWMPPEMIRNEDHGFPADVWSFAICMIEMADTQPPNRKSRILSLYESGTVGLKPYVEAQEGRYSKEFRDFLLRCLVLDPQDRATPSELLQHEFLRKACSKRALERAIR